MELQKERTFSVRQHRSLLPVLALGLGARILYILLFPHCYSCDLRSWSQVGDLLLSGGNPYNQTSLLTWPPLWMQLVYCLKILSIGLHLPFEHVVRGFLILAELGVELLLYSMLQRFTPAKKPSRFILAGIALNPISILQVCQHCNFDIIVGFWVLLAVDMLLRFQENHESRFWLFACFALGTGALTKTVPLCLTPLLLLSIRRLHVLEIGLGAALLFGPVCLGLSILYVLGPQQVWGNVICYRGCSGLFGFTGLFYWLESPALSAVWGTEFLILYGSACLGLGIWLLARESLPPKQILAAATGLLLAIPVIGPGYGTQFVYWFLPLFVLLYGFAEIKARILLLVLYTVAVITYVLLYALGSSFYGAFLLEIFPREDLRQLGSRLSSHVGQTLISIPLWLLYLVELFSLGMQTVRRSAPSPSKVLPLNMIKA